MKENIFMAKDLENETLVLLKSNYTYLERIAKALIEQETIYDADLATILDS